MTSIVPSLRKLQRTRVREYKQQFKHFLLTSRFNNKTWAENNTFKQTHNSIGCVYCCPDPVSGSIPYESVMFVLEMNNETNSIMGIGMVRNHPHIKRYHVYEESNYNRYIFIGKTRIDRADMNEEEERIMKVFDILCFTGTKHMKRGQGLKSFPTDMLYRCSKKMDLVIFIGEMFKRRLGKPK